MVNHKAIKTGIGLGLMALSLGASAALHTFGKDMIYYKVTGARVDYAAFLPSGAGASDSVIMLDVLQSGTLSTWNYAIGGVLGTAPSTGTYYTASTAGAGTSPITFTSSISSSYFTTGFLASYNANYANAGGSSSLFPTASANVGYIGNFSNAAGGQVWLAATVGIVTSYGADGRLATTSYSTYFGGDTQPLSLSFTELVSVSSQACNMSFSAALDTNDYLQFTNVVVQPSNWPSATSDVYYRTAAGTVAASTASIASDVFNGYNGSVTKSFNTYSAWTQTNAAASLVNSTFLGTALMSNYNKCVTGYTNRTATNSAGGIVGGKAGMMRLW